MEGEATGGKKNIVCDGHAPQTKHPSHVLHTLGGLGFCSGWVADMLGQACRIPSLAPPLAMELATSPTPCMRHRFLAKLEPNIRQRQPHGYRGGF